MNAPKKMPSLYRWSVAKEENPRSIILLRNGDFYETFYHDAETCAKTLGLTLTTQSKRYDPNPIPMCGFPYHALDAYLAKLIQSGKNVFVEKD